ncbi:MAG: hypothetical protein ACREQ4_14160 [Candidatus Binataceae bacterium]
MIRSGVAELPVVTTGPPANRFRRALTRLLALAIVAAGLALPGRPASAQQSPAAAPTGNAAAQSAPPTAASGGFQSQGIKATITSVSFSSPRTIVFQFVIQNTRPSGVYLALVSGYGGSAGTLMATNGAIYQMDPLRISGMPPCALGLSTTDANVKPCLEKSDEHTMTMIDSGQSGILGIAYDIRGGTPAAPTDTVNFALKFIVRAAPGQGDTLSAAASGAAGPPSVVTISFPLIPLASH